MRALACVLGLAMLAGPMAGAQAPAPGAPLDATTFAYSRAIPDGAGLTVLRLDAPALAHSRLDDIRIVDAKGRQVPYLLQRIDTLMELPLPALEGTTPRPGLDTRQLGDASKRTWYRLRLPYVGLPNASLRLSTSTRTFTRDIGVVIHESRLDDASDAGTDRVESAFWTSSDPDTAAPPLAIGLGGRLRTDSLFVLVNDGDNRKLSLDKPVLLLPQYRIRFYREAGNALRLLYGRKDLPAPTYDLELISARLLDAAAEEVTPAKENAKVSSFGRTPQLLFWIALALVVVILLLLIARLVNRSEP